MKDSENKKINRGFWVVPFWILMLSSAIGVYQTINHYLDGYLRNDVLSKFGVFMSVSILIWRLFFVYRTLKPKLIKIDIFLSLSLLVFSVCLIGLPFLTRFHVIEQNSAIGIFHVLVGQLSLFVGAFFCFFPAALIASLTLGDVFSLTIFLSFVLNPVIIFYIIGEIALIRRLNIRTDANDK